MTPPACPSSLGPLSCSLRLGHKGQHHDTRGGPGDPIERPLCATCETATAPEPRP